MSNIGGPTAPGPKLPVVADTETAAPKTADKGTSTTVDKSTGPTSPETTVKDGLESGPKTTSTTAKESTQPTGLESPKAPPKEVARSNSFTPPPMPEDMGSYLGEDPKLTTEGAADRLRDAMKGLGTNEKEIYRVLENRTMAEIECIEADFKNLTGGSLKDWLRGDMSGDELRKALLLMQGDDAQEDLKSASLLNYAMKTPLMCDKKSVLDVLYGKGPDELKEITKTYEHITGNELENDIKSKHSGSDEVYALAVLKRGRIEPADRFKAAMTGFFTDADGMKVTLKAMGDAGRFGEITALKKDYKEHYDVDLLDDLRKNCWPRDYTEIKALLENGTLHPEDEIKMAIMGKGYLNVGMWGFGTQPGSIEAVFADKTHEQRQEIVERFNNKYGNLEDALFRNLASEAYSDIKLILDPENATGKLSSLKALHRTWRGLGSDYKGAKELLEAMTPEERTQLKLDFKEEFKKDLEDTLEHEFWGQRGPKLVKILEQGKLSLADEVHFAGHGWRLTTDGDAIVEALRNATAEEITTLREDYRKTYNESLDKVVTGWTLNARHKEEIKLTLENGPLTPRLRCKVAMAGIGNDRKMIYDSLDNATPEELAEIKEDRLLMEEFKSNLKTWIRSTKPLQRVLTTIDKGGLDRHERLFYAIDGTRTSAEYIMSQVKELSFEDRAATISAYKEKYDRDLLTDLKGCMKSREFFKIEDELMPKPRSIRESIDQIEYRVGRERGSGSARSVASDAIVDVFSNKGTYLDQEVREFKALPRLAFKAGGKPALAAVAPELEVKRHTIDSATEDYVASKDKIANNISTVATLTAAATVVAATGGMAAPAALATIAAVTGATKVGSRMLVQGDSYDINGYDGLYDFGTGAAEGAAMFAIGAVGNEITALVGKQVLAAEGVDVSAQGLHALGQEALGEAAATATDAAIMEAANGVLLEKGGTYMGQSFGHQFGTGIAMGAVKGMTYSGVTGVAQTLLDDKLWEQDFPSAIKQLLKETADSATGGAEGWTIGTAAWNIGAVAAESAMMQLRLGIGNSLASKNRAALTDEKLLSAGNDILGSSANGLSSNAIRAAGYDKIMNDLGDDFLKNTIQGKILASTVNNSVTRGVAAYPKTFFNSLNDHEMWKYGIGAGVAANVEEANESGMDSAIVFTGADLAGTAAADSGMTGARVTAAKNLVRRGLAATV